MFNINHTAISVSDINKSTDFYKMFGFVECKSWTAEDKAMQIKHLKLGADVLELFCFKNCKPLPVSSAELSTDLPVIGSKHFALGVDDIEKAKEFVIKNNIKSNVEIITGKLGRKYFFIKDPDGILMEIIENDK